MRTPARGQIDTTFFLVVGVLVVFGLVILTSASSPMGYERFGDSYYFLKHQITSGLLPGIVALAITLSIPYQAYRKWAFPMLGISIILLILVFIPGVGADYGTFAKSWVSIGSIAFQPAELVKLTFLIYLAAWM
ncbi:FtsW/RodA/SpoVE family cell cycle protein, partial [Patescibacteria group bacterium]|nr:FtsW/RodA/SpoVE family cell cycle protein [Patescibacteria group bacterium]